MKSKGSGGRSDSVYKHVLYLMCLFISFSLLLICLIFVVVCLFVF